MVSRFCFPRFARAFFHFLLYLCVFASLLFTFALKTLGLLSSSVPLAILTSKNIQQAP